MVERRAPSEGRKEAKGPGTALAQGPVTVDRILAAGARLFADRGYYNTSMDEVASVVGILKGSLYHHVPSKEQILDLILDRMVFDLVSRTEEVGRQDASAEVRFENMVRILVQNVGAFREANAIYTTERIRLPANIRKKYRKLLRGHRHLFESVVRQLVDERSDSPNIDLSLAVTSIISLTSMMSVWYRPRGRLTLVEIESEFVRQARRIIGLTT